MSGTDLFGAVGILKAVEICWAVWTTVALNPVALLRQLLITSNGSFY